MTPGSDFCSRVSRAALRSCWARFLRAQSWRLALLSGTMGRPRPEIDPDIRRFPFKAYAVFFPYGPGTFEVVNIVKGLRDLMEYFPIDERRFVLHLDPRYRRDRGYRSRATGATTGFSLTEKRLPFVRELRRRCPGPNFCCRRFAASAVERKTRYAVAVARRRPPNFGSSSQGPGNKPRLTTSGAKTWSWRGHFSRGSS